MLGTEEHAGGRSLYDYWPAIIGLSVAVLVAGIILLLKGAGLPGGLIILVYFAALVAAFLYQEVRRWPAVSSKAMSEIQERVGIVGEPEVIGSIGYPIAIFLFTEVMFFAGAFAMYFYTRFSFFPTWPPPGAPILDIFIPTIQTGFLIASSIMIEWAVASVKKGNQLGVKMGVLGCLVLGTGFFVLQFGFEWPHLLDHHILSLKDFYGASFFLLTGIHGSHVFGGMLALSVTSVRAFLGQFTEKSHGFLEAVSTYWHFVHIVWLFLFAFLFQGGLKFLQ